MSRHAPLVAAALAVLAASPVLAQDAGGPVPGAPAKHVNKVTDAAKAAFERMEKAIYRPVAAGLKEMTGTMEMKMEGGGMEGGPGGGPGGRGMPGGGGMNLSFGIDFKAPDRLKVEPKSDGGRMGMMSEGMKKSVHQMMKVSLGLMRPGDEEEFDADAATVEGRTVLTIVRYENNVETNRNSMTLDDRGLIESTTGSSKAVAPPMGGRPGGRMGGAGGPPGGAGGEEKNSAKYTWKKEGDRWLLDTMTSTGPRGDVAMTLLYADAGGYKIVAGWSTKGGPEGRFSFNFKFSDVSVNGKKVEMKPVAPAPEKPAEGGMGGDGK